MTTTNAAPRPGVPEQRKALVERDGREELPAWLTAFGEGAQFDLGTFLRGRVVFYPGCWTDGHAVELFGGAGAAHAFVMVDQSPNFRDAIAKSLRPDSPKAFRGYAVGCRCAVDAEALGAKWAELCVLDRVERLDDSHGPARLAVLFVEAEANATFERLFGGEGEAATAPFAVVLHDHRFGGRFDSPFGGRHTMFDVVERTGHRPEWLFVARNTTAWPGYRRVEGAGVSAAVCTARSGDCGGGDRPSAPSVRVVKPATRLLDGSFLRFFVLISSLQGCSRKGVRGFRQSSMRPLAPSRRRGCLSCSIALARY